MKLKFTKKMLAAEGGSYNIIFLLRYYDNSTKCLPKLLHIGTRNFDVELLSQTATNYASLGFIAVSNWVQKLSSHLISCHFMRIKSKQYSIILNGRRLAKILYKPFDEMTYERLQ